MKNGAVLVTVISTGNYNFVFESDNSMKVEWRPTSENATGAILRLVIPTNDACTIGFEDCVNARVGVVRSGSSNGGITRL